ncbi:MAG: hypothetical protein VB142_03355 [Burkholderia sp.]
MHSQLFETALGISDPWFVNGIGFDASAKRLTVNIDFVAGSRFPHPEMRRRPSRARHRCQALPALELLPARLLSRSVDASRQAI